MAETFFFNRTLVLNGVVRFGLIYAAIGTLLIAAPQALTSGLDGDWSGTTVAMTYTLFVAALFIGIPQFVGSNATKESAPEVRSLILPVTGTMIGQRVKKTRGLTAGELAGWFMIVLAPMMYFPAYLNGVASFSEFLALSGFFASWGASLIVIMSWGRRYCTVLDEVIDENLEKAYVIRYDNGEVDTVPYL